jgi:glutamine amidotransferase
MSSRLPADVTSSLKEFARRGGCSGPHRDGWGIAYSEDRDVRVIKDIDAACESPCARFVAERAYRGRTVISHIRKATRGEVALRNTQPFVRELGGRLHVFAHNGDLTRNGTPDDLELGRHRPVGETDSEVAFCALLHLLRDAWRGESQPPSLDERLQVLGRFASTLRGMGPANFAYFDGDAVFLHGHKRMPAESEEPRPPGLHVLCRSCEQHGTTLSSAALTLSADIQTVVLAASVALTSESWQPLEEGEIVVARDGVIVRRVRDGRSR